MSARRSPERPETISDARHERPSRAMSDLRFDRVVPDENVAHVAIVVFLRAWLRRLRGRVIVLFGPAAHSSQAPSPAPPPPACCDTVASAIYAQIDARRQAQRQWHADAVSGGGSGQPWAAPQTSGRALYRRALPVSHDSSLLGAVSSPRVPCGLARHPQPPVGTGAERPAPLPHAVRQPREGSAQPSAARDCHTMSAREPRGADPAPVRLALSRGRPSVPLVGQIVLGSSRWHAILSRRCQKGPGDLHMACLSAFVSMFLRTGTPVALPTRAPGGRRQQRHGGAVYGEFGGSVSG